MDNRTGQHQEYEIEALLEWLGLLKIIKKALEKTTEYIDNILTASVVYNETA